MGKNEKELEGVFKKIYNPNQSLIAKGTYKTLSGKGLLNKLLTLFIAIPKATIEKPITLEIERKNNVEIWKRNFNGTHFDSTFQAIETNYFHEKFGAFDFYFDVNFGSQVTYKSKKVSFLKIPISWFVKIECNNYQINEDEWHFEIILNSLNNRLLFKYFGRMKIEKLY